MCFSDVASFTVAAACACAGTYAVLKSPSPRYLTLATIPLFFAVHQATEGAIWRAIGLSADGVVSGDLPAVFKFFATIFWPVFIPFAVYMAEEHPGRRSILAVLMGIGALVSFAYLIPFVNSDVSAGVIGHSVHYTSPIKAGIAIPVWLLSGAQGGSDWILVPYAAATIGSLACSSLLPVRLFAVIVTIALAVLMVVNQTTLVSVWCFFAASGSLMIVPSIQAARFRSASASKFNAIPSQTPL
jgi:hypothetical protein